MGNIVRMKKSGVFKAVILAGGSGERFWPLSTAKKPKQFLRVFGGESLIRQSVQRLGDEVPPENVFVVVAKNLIAATRKELPELPKAISSANRFAAIPPPRSRSGSRSLRPERTIP